MFTLYKNNKALLNAKHWEYLVSFVEELKELNKKYVDRREFTVKGYDEVLYFIHGIGGNTYEKYKYKRIRAKMERFKK